MITYASYSLNLMHTTSFSSLMSTVFSLVPAACYGSSTPGTSFAMVCFIQEMAVSDFRIKLPIIFYMISAIRKNFVPVILSGRSERTTSLSTFQTSISFSNVHAAFAGLVDGRHKASRPITALVYLL